MECNKEEAIRAKEIAERKMESKDFVGAQKLALKAQQLFPELENISQMLTVCDVHCSSVVTVSGSELDWYGILQVERTADEAFIKRQYRKLALLLHPDKNKFAGAEAAFKLIGEAQRVLTDRAKRSLYDMKRNVNVKATGTRQAPPHMNRNYNAGRQPTAQNNFTNNSASHIPGMNQQQTQTFWTICPFCRIRYQYYHNVMNRALRCQNCTKPFIAYDVNVQGTQPGGNSGHTWNQSESTLQRDVPTSCTGFRGTSMPESTSKKENSAKFGGRSQNKTAEDGDTAETRAESSDEKLEKANRKARNQKRGRKMVIEESSESCNSDSSDEDEIAVEGDLHPRQTAEPTNSRYPRRSTRQQQRVVYNENESDDDDFVDLPSSKKSRRDGSSGALDDQSDEEFEFSEVNADKTRGEATGTAVFDEKQAAVNPCEDSLPNGEEAAGTCKKIGKQQVEDGKKEESSKEENSSVEDSGVDSGYQAPSPECMTYAEPEFTDFDKDRAESCFAVDHIWAAYDENGCMPRFYARIRKILSEKSKVEIVWLEPDPDPHDQVVHDWVEEGLPTSCGIFRTGGKDQADFSSFSHLVSCEQGRTRGTYLIYPRKGDIWALFKDWNSNWSSDPDMHREYKFEFVEVLSDYDERNGIRVAYLIKLKGFVSLFHRSRSNRKDPFQIPPNEMLRFSHRIPSHRMTGNERESVPVGSYELDPASLPYEIEEVECMSFDNLPADLEFMEAEPNGSCSRSTAEFDECKEVGEANANVCGTVKGKHLDAGGRSPVDAAKRSSPSTIAPNGENFDYPDPEFYSFEVDKSIDKFQPDQIWTLYSDVDSLPKFYGKIMKVASTDFEVEIKWLEVSRQRQAEGKGWWPCKELPVGCGKFLLSQKKNVSFNTPSTFSHQVKARSPSKNRYDIYPSVDQIWAVYKNLSIDWSTKDMESCEYELVRILDDIVANYTARFKVMILEKVSGYNSVFRDTGTVREISQNDLLVFSHQIPAFRLTEERGGKLRGFYELDPAAVPPILLCTSLN